MKKTKKTLKGSGGSTSEPVEHVEPGKTGKPKSGARWCVTEGWGNLERVVKPWASGRDLESAYDALEKYAKRTYPRTFMKVWTQTFLGRGVVCDFGDHRFFGFVELQDGSAILPPAYGCDVSVVGQVVPDVPKVSAWESVHDCLSSTWGVALTDLFQDYLRRAESAGSGWFTSHALEYCCVSEWWEMFCQDDPDISPVWENDMSPEDVYNGVVGWAKCCTDAPEILLQNSPDARWDAFRAGLLWGSKRP